MDNNGRWDRICGHISFSCSISTTVNTFYSRCVYHLSNSALTLLFGLSSTPFVVLSDVCKEVAKAFPRSLLWAQNNHSHRFKFQWYVVCCKCHRLSYLVERSKLFISMLPSSQTTPNESHLCVAKNCGTVRWMSYNVSMLLEMSALLIVMDSLRGGEI